MLRGYRSANLNYARPRTVEPAEKKAKCDTTKMVTNLKINCTNKILMPTPISWSSNTGLRICLPPLHHSIFNRMNDIPLPSKNRWLLPLFTVVLIVWVVWISEIADKPEHQATPTKLNLDISKLVSEAERQVALSTLNLEFCTSSVNLSAKLPLRS